MRFYLNKDIRNIDRKITSNYDGLLGYFIASLVDVLIVFLFDDLIKDLLKKTLAGNIKAQVLIRTGLIASLIVAFITVSWLVKAIREGRRQKKLIEGKSLYEGDEKDDITQRLIDRFDNVACDGLLACADYRKRYLKEKNQNIRNFYLFEIVHYLKKAEDIFSVIYHNKSEYIALESKDNSDRLIASYRANNFMDFSVEILEFLEKETKELSDVSLQKDMANLTDAVRGWEKI